MSALTVLPFFQLFDNSGDELSGGLIYTYQAGTSTPQNTYTDSTGSVAFSNPIVLDSSGRPSGPIYLSISPAYKFVIKTSGGSTLTTYDNYIAYAPAS